MRHQENHPSGCWWGVKPPGQCILIPVGDGHESASGRGDCQPQGGRGLGWRGSAPRGAICAWRDAPAANRRAASLSP